MAWIYLIIAGLLEITWAVCMKLSDGFTKLVPSAITIFALVLSFAFLSLAVRTLPLGISYAIWTGLGAAGGFIAGIIIFKEPASALQILFLCLVVVGIAGLSFFNPHH